MAYYLITVVLKNEVKTGIKEMELQSIDKLYPQYEMIAKGRFPDLKTFNIAQVSKYSQEVRNYLAKKGKKDEKDKIDIDAYIRKVYEDDWKQKKLDKEKGENPGKRS